MNILTSLFNYFNQIDYSTPVTSAHLKDLTYSDDYLKIYADIINKQIDHQRAHPGEIRLRKGDSGTPFTFTVINKDPYWIDIVIIVPKKLPGALLGDGSRQKVKSSITLHVTFLPTNEITVLVNKTALHRFKTDVDCNSAMNTVSIQKELISKLPHTAKIASAPTATRTYTSKRHKTRLEMDTLRYETDLYYAIRDRKVDKAESLQVLIGLEETLQAIHDIGFVHRDIKPENILIKSHEGYLNDFDLTRKIGHQGSGSKDEYIYWDACSHAGIALPNTDIYGLAVSAFKILTDSLQLNSSTTWLAGHRQAEVYFQNIFLHNFPKLQLNKTLQTLPELIQILDTHIQKQNHPESIRNVYRLLKAQGKIIEVMAREEKNSKELFNYYQTNPSLHEDINTFLISAKSAIPTLSTVQSLMAELREIHKILLG